MSLARQEFLVRLDTLVACLSEGNLNDGPPTEHLRNQVAGMMRQGLAVLTFAALESFVRERTAECLKGFDPNAIAFADLSDEIQRAATLGAIEGLVFRSKFEDSSNRHNWAFKQLKSIASSDTTLANISHLSFGSNKANLDEDDISKVLKAFGIENAWPNITDVAKRAGMGGLLDAKAQFVQIKKTRHSSAHDVALNVPHADLSSSIRAICGIGIGFDLLLSHALTIHNKGRVSGKASEPKIETKHIKLLFVAENSNSIGSYEIYRMQAATQVTPAVKISVHTFSSKLETLMYAVEEAENKQEQIVDVGYGGAIIDWHTG